MAIITIPFDYDPQRDAESVIPIYLNDTDDNGETIFFGWVEAVVRVQEGLRALSRNVLGDVWRVSELTDLTILRLWRKHRQNLGCNPGFRVYVTARRIAHSLEDPGARVHLALNVSLDALEEFRRYAVGDVNKTERAYCTTLDLQRFEARLKELGKKNELDVYRMLKAGYHWYEIGQRVGERPNTVYRRFRRLLRRIVGLSERNCGSTEFLADERVPRRKVRSSTERDSTRDTPKLSESGPAGLSERLDSQEPRHESLQHKS